MKRKTSDLMKTHGFRRNLISKLEVKCSVATTLLIIFCTLALFASCAFPFQSDVNKTVSIKDISDTVTFEKISQQGFMGGSVLYNPSKPSAGQLADNVTMAIRLGTVTKESVGYEQDVYTDIGEEAEFGLLHVKNVNEDSISFTVKLFNVSGSRLASGSFAVALGEKVDVNYDGIPDIEYKKALRNREGFEDSIYLTFLSSQETLSTSMFAVLPEQYSRGAYPSGIIGINPNGRFIIRKYEEDNITRSAVLGMQNGDYVLDTITGKYQTVVDAKSSKNVRSISDTELRDIEDVTVHIAPEFKIEEFASLYVAEDLLAALPSSVLDKVSGTENAIEILNEVLKDQDLIENVSAVQETAIPQEIYSEVVAQIASLTETELMQLNRFFLEETFPEVCPITPVNSSAIADILPLASLTILPGGDSVSSESSEVRATSESEYEKERNEILKDFTKYYRPLIGFDLSNNAKVNYINDVTNIKNIFSDIMFFFTGKKTEIIEKKDKADFNVQLTDSYAGIGIRTNFKITWGSLDSAFGASIFFHLDTLITTKVDYGTNLKTINYELVNADLHPDIPIFSTGPILFKITLSSNFSLPLEVNFSGAGTFNGRAAAIGLYGADVEFGLKYGVTWKKAWIFKVPTNPYVRGYGNPVLRNRTAYYIGTTSHENITFKNISVVVAPTLKYSLNAVFFELVRGSVSAGATVEAGVSVKNENLYLIGEALFGLKPVVEAGVEIGIPWAFLRNIGFKSYTKNWDIIEFTEKNQKINLGYREAWQVFKTKL